MLGATSYVWELSGFDVVSWGELSVPLVFGMLCSMFGLSAMSCCLLALCVFECFSVRLVGARGGCFFSFGSWFCRVSWFVVLASSVAGPLEAIFMEYMSPKLRKWFAMSSIGMACPMAVMVLCLVVCGSCSGFGVWECHRISLFSLSFSLW